MHGKKGNKTDMGPNVEALNLGDDFKNGQQPTKEVTTWHG